MTWICLGLMLVISARLIGAPRGIAAAHLRFWHRLGVHPAEPDAFQLGMYRIVGGFGVIFVAVIAILKLVQE